MQEIRIEGYVGKDPQIKEANGRKYAQVRVGCSSKTNKVDNKGNDIYETTWYNVFAAPENVAGVMKGTRVLVTGKPKYSTYMGNDEQIHIDVTIAFANIYISTYVSKKGSKNENDHSTTTQTYQPTQPVPQMPQDSVTFEEVSSDDLPF